MAESEIELEEAHELIEEVLDSAQEVVIADREFLENIMLAILARERYDVGD